MYTSVLFEVSNEQSQIYCWKLIMFTMCQVWHTVLLHSQSKTNKMKTEIMVALKIKAGLKLNKALLVKCFFFCICAVTVLGYFIAYTPTKINSPQQCFCYRFIGLLWWQFAYQWANRLWVNTIIFWDTLFWDDTCWIKHVTK